MISSEVCQRLKVDLQLKRKVVVSHLEPYAKIIKPSIIIVPQNNKQYYDWSEENYKHLLTIFEE